ncbi:trimeric intracellular cation channel family protein [Oxalobacter sp. OttesenSCG-928-P03]|nr:trimeric intracellular cation channel family protein [Oxalobacter sp. OttesenSCG-928-P03]
MKASLIFLAIDLIGTFIFAMSGAAVGIRRHFDIFGIFALAAATGIGGGIIRDLCIGATPPPGLTDPFYMLMILLAVVASICFRKTINRLELPALYLDAIGLGFFAAFGANKTYLLTGNLLLAILMGCVSGVGGGCIRDILSGSTPHIFSREIYATAAIAGACIELLGSTGIISPIYSTWIAIVVCSTMRILALHFRINLPRVRASSS